MTYERETDQDYDGLSVHTLVGTEARSFTSTALRAGAVAAVLSLAVSGVAYAAAVKATPEAPAPGVVEAALMLPAVGEPSSTPQAQAVTFRLVVDGRGREVSTAAGSWGLALLEAGVGVDTAAGDRVSVALDGVPVSGETVVVDHVVVSSESKEDKEAYGTVEEETDELDKGERKVRTPGVDGVTRTTYTVRTVGGQELSREVSAQVVATAKVDEVVLVGTREKKQEPSGSGAQAGSQSEGSGSSSAGQDSALSGTAASGDVWAALAQCESGGNPSINTGNGYYGMYQFSLPTWQSLGGSGLPSEASAAEQTAMAQKLQARAGWGQWPSCARQLGLR